MSKIKLTSSTFQPQCTANKMQYAQNKMQYAQNKQDTVCSEQTHNSSNVMIYLTGIHGPKRYLLTNYSLFWTNLVPASDFQF